MGKNDIQTAKEEVIKKLIVDVFGDENPMTTICPDQFVGECVFSANGFIVEATERKDIDFSKKYKEPIIAIILESPHKYEYKNESVGPAKGTTGRLFFNEFGNYLNKSKIASNLSQKDKYKIVFMNSIQYQTSQGKPLNCIENKCKRDELWLKMFDSFGKDNLLERIKSLKPDVVINLCTMGFNNLQLKVDNALKENNAYIYTIGTHPSTWNFQYAHIE